MRLSENQVNSIMQGKGLQNQLAAVARRVATRAQSITDESGGEAEISVETGIRPGGRAFANIESDSAVEEYGSEKKTRRRALGQALRER